MSRSVLVRALCTVWLLIGIAPAARADCLLTCPYASQPYPNYGCSAVGGYLITSWSFQDLGGGAISVHPNPNGIVPTLTGTMDCDGSTFQASGSVPGPCSVFYTLSGIIGSPSQWSGTFTVQFFGGPPCQECMNQTIGVQGSCSPTDVPDEMILGSGWIAASPNPSQGSTSLQFYAPGDVELTLEVFDVTGRQLRTLIDGVVLPRGVHETPWSAAMGSSTASAVHFARLTAGAHVEITRFVVVR